MTVEQFQHLTVIQLSRYLRMDAGGISRAATRSDILHKNKCFCNRNFTLVQLKKKCVLWVFIERYRKKVASSAGNLMVDY